MKQFLFGALAIFLTGWFLFKMVSSIIEFLPILIVLIVIFIIIRAIVQISK